MSIEMVFVVIYLHKKGNKCRKKRIERWIEWHFSTMSFKAGRHTKNSLCLKWKKDWLKTRFKLFFYLDHLFLHLKLHCSSFCNVGGLPSSLSGSVPFIICTLCCRSWRDISYRCVFESVSSKVNDNLGPKPLSLLELETWRLRPLHGRFISCFSSC